MKPLYSPATVQFRVMKEQPEITPDGTIIFPWATFFVNGIVHTWDNNGVGGENWNANDYPDENKYLQALARTPYKNPAPFQPGEKCYLRETWQLAPIKTTDWYFDGTCIMPGTEDRPHTRSKWNSVHNVIYRADGEYTSLSGAKTTWSSPVTLPQWAARRFFEVVSCEPMRIGEVTEEDARKTGIQFIEHDKWNGQDFWGIKGDYDTYAPNAYGSFLFIWEKKHPGKEWAWRIEVRED
jgi:hypothetical protein